MIQTLFIIIVVLVILLVGIFIQFYRRGQRLNEEIKHAIDNENIKSHYLADASQTFQDPIYAILSHCEILESKPCYNNNPEVKEAIEDIHFQCNQLLQYTSEILEISNTEGNIPHSSKIQVNLIELIMSYRREILYEVKTNVQVNIRTEMSPHTKVWLDTTMFRQLIMHILRIAAENTMEGFINIRYAPESNGLRFWIENTCEPLPKEAHEYMFKGQENTPINIQNSKGNEIVFTMSVCKGIIENLKGTIEAYPDESTGTYLNVITYWFPCALSVH